MTGRIHLDYRRKVFIRHLSARIGRIADDEAERLAQRCIAVVGDAGESMLRLALDRAARSEPHGWPAASAVKAAHEEIAAERERLSDLGVCVPRMPARTRSLEQCARMDAMVARMKAAAR